MARIFWFRAPILDQPPPAARLAAGRRRKDQRFHRRGGAAGPRPAGLLRDQRAAAPPGSGALALLFPAASASLIGFVWWEGRAPADRRIERFLCRFRVITASSLMYMVTFGPVVAFPGPPYRLPLPLAGAVLATGFVAMAATSPGRSSWSDGRRQRSRWGRWRPARLFVVVSWQPDSAPDDIRRSAAGSSPSFRWLYGVVMAACRGASRRRRQPGVLTRVGTVTGRGADAGFQTIASAAQPAARAKRKRSSPRSTRCSARRRHRRGDRCWWRGRRAALLTSTGGFKRDGAATIAPWPRSGGAGISGGCMEDHAYRIIERPGSKSRSDTIRLR